MTDFRGNTETPVSQGKFMPARSTSEDIHLRIHSSSRSVVKYQTYLGYHDSYVVGGNGHRDWLQFVMLDWHSLGVAYVGE